MTLKPVRFPFIRDRSGLRLLGPAAARPIANGENVLLLGPIDKTHPAVALVPEAMLAGHSVQFVAATTVVAQFAKGHSEGRLEERLAQFAKPKLLTVDELG